MINVLTIAGFDPVAGAGVQRDLMVFSGFGVYGTSAITCITAQNTQGVDAVFPLEHGLVKKQIDSILSDVDICAIKTGMLGTKEIVRVVRGLVKGRENIVVDPVIMSTSGTHLLDNDAIPELKKLISAAALSTPNRYEAEMISGIKIEGESDLKRAASKIGNCVITDESGVDLVHIDGKFEFLTGKRIDIKTHGSGCTFSSAIAANLAMGKSPIDSVKIAKRYTESAIAKNIAVGKGFVVLGFPDAGTFYADETLNLLQGAVNVFVSDKNAYKLAPEVGINIAFAKEGTKTIGDVAGLSGRIVKADKRLVPAGTLRYGGSSHVGRVVLTAMKFDPNLRAAMNIRFSDEAVDICRKRGIAVSSFKRQEQPPDTKTMEWGTKKAMEKLDTPPTPIAIFDLGAVGKEAMIRLIGRTPQEVVETALAICKRLGVI